MFPIAEKAATFHDRGRYDITRVYNNGGDRGERLTCGDG